MRNENIYVNSKGYSLDYVKDYRLQDAYGRFIDKFPSLFPSDKAVKVFFDNLFSVTRNAQVITQQLHLAIEQGHLTPEQVQAQDTMIANWGRERITNSSQIRQNKKGINLDFIWDWTLRDIFARVVDSSPKVTDEETAKRLYYAMWEATKAEVKTEDKSAIAAKLINDIYDAANLPFRENKKGYKLEFIKHPYLRNLVSELIDKVDEHPEGKFHIGESEEALHIIFNRWMKDGYNRLGQSRLSEEDKMRTVELNVIKKLEATLGKEYVLNKYPIKIKQNQEIKTDKKGYAAQRPRLSTFWSSAEDTKRLVEGIIADLCFYHPDAQEAIVEFFFTPYWKESFNQMRLQLIDWVSKDGIYRKYDWKSSYLLNLCDGGMCPYADWTPGMKPVEECTEYKPSKSVPSEQEVPSEQAITLDFKDVPETGQDITQQELFSTVFMAV